MVSRFRSKKMLEVVQHEIEFILVLYTISNRFAWHKVVKKRFFQNFVCFTSTFRHKEIMSEPVKGKETKIIQQCKSH